MVFYIVVCCNTVGCVVNTHGTVKCKMMSVMLCTHSLGCCWGCPVCPERPRGRTKTSPASSWRSSFFEIAAVSISALKLRSAVARDLPGGSATKSTPLLHLTSLHFHCLHPLLVLSLQWSAVVLMVGQRYHGDWGLGDLEHNPMMKDLKQPPWKIIH